MYKAISIDYYNLEPFLRQDTISIHFNRHYISYLNKFNDFFSMIDFSNINEEYEKTIEEI